MMYVVEISPDIGIALWVAVSFAPDATTNVDVEVSCFPVVGSVAETMTLCVPDSKGVAVVYTQFPFASAVTTTVCGLEE